VKSRIELIEQSKYALDRGLRRVGFDPSVLRYGYGFEEQDLRTLQRVRKQTMTSPERLVAVCESVRYLVRHDIPGAIVECGVWRGGTMMAAALTLMDLGEVRPLYLYDTFAGMSAPGPADEDARGQSARVGMEHFGSSEDGSSLWCNASLEIVRSNMESTGYPMEHVVFVEGPVEETIPGRLPESIALLRLDTDWYESTAHELKHLFPLISDYGTLAIDDYGHWKGSRKAVDEYLAAEGRPIMLTRTDYTGRLAVVPPRA
jgi:hypothetical protein